MQWLAVSIVSSVVLTVMLNVVLRAFPSVGDRASDRLAELSRSAVSEDAHGRSRVRVVIPWKAMLLASVLLTAVLNLALWIR